MFPKSVQSITILLFGQILPFRRPYVFLSVPEHHHFKFFGGFSVRETVIFRMQSVRQRRGLAAGQSAQRQTRPGNSGESHFHAQNGSSSFRSPSFLSSKRLNSFRRPSFSRTGSAFRSLCPCFCPCEYPPPPAPGGGGGGNETRLSEFWICFKITYKFGKK